MEDMVTRETDITMEMKTRKMKKAGGIFFMPPVVTLVLSLNVFFMSFLTMFFVFFMTIQLLGN